MRFFIFILVLIVFFSCAQYEDIEVKYEATWEEIEPLCDTIILINGKPYCCSSKVQPYRCFAGKDLDTLEIQFLSGFQEDTVVLMNNVNTIFQKILSSDFSTDIASRITVSKSEIVDNNFILEINQRKYKIPVKNVYNFMRVFYTERTPSVSFSNMEGSFY